MRIVVFPVMRRTEGYEIVDVVDLDDQRVVRKLGNTSAMTNLDVASVPADFAPTRLPRLLVDDPGVLSDLSVRCKYDVPLEQARFRFLSPATRCALARRTAGGMR